jgi:hypothetical protein
MKIAAASGSTMLDAFKALPDGGTLIIYSGTQPTNPDTALSGNTALATFTFNSPSFGTNSSSGGYQVTTASFVAGTVTAGATGTASFARVLKSNGTTAVADVTVGTSGADVNLNSVSITSGGNVTLTSFQFKMPID